MSVGELPVEIQRLRRRFHRLVAFEGGAGLLAALCLLGYFRLHLSLCLPIFAAAVGLAVAAQLAFVVAVGRGGGGPG